MRHFQGKATGLDRPVVFRVSSPWIDIHGDFIAPCYTSTREDCPPDLLLFSGTINPDTVKSNSFQVLSDGSNPHTGDVILLEPTGRGTVLFDASSDDNAFFLTGECNCNCVMCPQPPKADQENFTSLILEVIDLLPSETRMIGITGGEPTLKWDGLLQILTRIQKKAPEATIQILTNGRELKSYLKSQDLLSTCENAKFFSIPLYGDTDTLHDLHMGVQGAFWDTIEGIYNLARLEAIIELRVLITQHNYPRLVEISDFIYRTMPFVDHVAFMGLEPVGIAKKNLQRLWVDIEQCGTNLVDALRHLSRRGIESSIFNIPRCVLPAFARPFVRNSISDWKRCYFEQCETCTTKKVCGGVFNSALSYFKDKVRVI